MLALTNAIVYTMLDTAPSENCTILIDQDKIIDVGPDIVVPKECRIIDAHGKIITPGLIDAHTHWVFTVKDPNYPPMILVKIAKPALRPCMLWMLYIHMILVCCEHI